MRLNVAKAKDAGSVSYDFPNGGVAICLENGKMIAYRKFGLAWHWVHKNFLLVNEKKKNKKGVDKPE